MNVFKANLLTKNNTKNGFYLYAPIVEIKGRYFICKSIKTKIPTKNFSNQQLNISREIHKEFYLANGILEN